ncbi:dipeptide ABC transporter ATP-binding protein [Flaviflagellibacter deserti]|uniref:Dipeptide ABC transporter ATP-binding protein n=1 Tax=Flaviflagellibacter deserti TaxID=2267266 RepID=A0ABV9YZ17_9HYPH
MKAVSAHELVQIYKVPRGMFAEPAKLTAVGGVSFDIEPGKTLAVVGESGSGKSTLGRMVALIEPATSGQLEIEGADVAYASKIDRAKLRRHVQFVFQNPYGSLNPRRKVGAILEEPLIAAKRGDRSSRRAKVRETMARVGLRPEHADRYPHMFSGGQRQRIAIARALILEPSLIVADEPVSALDVSVQAQVLNLLTDLQRDMGLAYLFISHDLGVVRHLAHDLLVLYLGTALEQGPKDVIFARPLHPYTRALLASTPDINAPRRERIILKGEPPSPFNPPVGCVFSTRCPTVTEHCRQVRPVLRPVDGRMIACHYAERVLTGEVGAS